jgi:hypothetical protein
MAIDALMGTFCDVDDMRLRKASERAELEAAEPAASAAAAVSDAATRRRTAK